MGSLKFVTVSVLVNGSPSDEFVPERGIRDPLAPFLFLIVVEGLNGLVKKAASMKKLSGVKVGKNQEVEVSILQFVDDTIFSGEASLETVSTWKCILRCFELASGLKINFKKSSCGGIAVDGGC
ncbi:uncharacterized mitochondrial protein AtMg01250-like [Lotus japonicus]|uniref:uncharacterized mitochondrial protein AtMg01250-like n=1 Tax=Lotus japonicus TaxID=34305 RepID=UPI00258DEABD|nr:uncharacterized mitochondrial protein AtMg01250-like [Lotus japonicus]